MSLPVSQYEALLAEVRGLRRKAQRVQQLATPLISNCSSLDQRVLTPRHHHYQDEGVNSSSSYKMDPLLTGRQHNVSSTNYDIAASSSADGDTTCSEDEYGGARSTHLSVSSEPITHHGDRGGISMLYHGTWPVERTMMWNSEPTPNHRSSAPTHHHHNNNNHLQEVTSVMSFASSAGGVPLDRVLGSPILSRGSSQQQLEAKVDMVYSLLAMLSGQEHADMGETLLALSTNPESCLAMRQSGCIPLLVQILQSDREPEARKKASQALHNLVHSQPDEKMRKREVRVFKLLEHTRAYTEALRNNRELELEVTSLSSEDDDQHPVQTVAHLMKLSFDELHRQAICTLGGIHTIAGLVEAEHVNHGSTAEEAHCILMRRYACMALTNLTFGDSGNKALLCSFREFMRALVVQLQSPSDELRQVTASVLRNLSWRADSTSQEILREVGSVTGLMKAAMLDNKENTLKSILSALWNLSAHCTENKSEICSVEGALGFLVDTLTYKTPSKSLAIIENSGGILRNISSQIAVREDYREVLRQHNCLQVLLEQLKSPSLTIVSNACGALWNLSAKCAMDQEALWQLGAPSMLRSLNHSKHKMIAMGSSAALKNLLSSRPSQQLLPAMDATALAMDLPVLPTLGARKQKALLQDLDQTLSETYENLEDLPVRKEDNRRNRYKQQENFTTEPSTSFDTKCNLSVSQKKCFLKTPKIKNSTPLSMEDNRSLSTWTDSGLQSLESGRIDAESLNTSSSNSMDNDKYRRMREDEKDHCSIEDVSDSDNQSSLGLEHHNKEEVEEEARVQSSTKYVSSSSNITMFEGDIDEIDMEDISIHFASTMEVLEDREKQDVEKEEKVQVAVEEEIYTDFIGIEETRHPEEAHTVSNQASTLTARPHGSGIPLPRSLPRPIPSSIHNHRHHQQQQQQQQQESSSDITMNNNNEVSLMKPTSKSNRLTISSNLPRRGLPTSTPIRINTRSQPGDRSMETFKEQSIDNISLKSDELVSLPLRSLMKQDQGTDKSLSVVHSFSTTPSDLNEEHNSHEGQFEMKKTPPVDVSAMTPSPECFSSYLNSVPRKEDRDHFLERSCEENNPVDNRMLDPDAMIESLDRFTAELVSHSSHLQQSKEEDKYKDNTWSEDTSMYVTFPTFSISGPNVITFEDSSVAKEEVKEEPPEYSSLTMTASTLIAIEATKMASVFKNEAEMSESVSSVASLELDRVQPPSLLLDETTASTRSPKLSTRKRSLPRVVMVKRALVNNLHSSVESLDNHSSLSSNLDQVNPPSAMADVLDLEGSFVNAQVQSVSDLEHINPPSLFNEITDMCNSLADVSTEAIVSEEVFEDCQTHVPATEDELTEQFSDANSATPIQSSDTEMSPKKHKILKQRRSVKDRYKTYTVAPGEEQEEEEEEEGEEKQSTSEEFKTVQSDSASVKEKSFRLTPKERRQMDRSRFETRVVEEAITDVHRQPVIEVASPTRTKLSIRRNFMQKRLENRDRFKTQTVDVVVLTPDDEVHLMVQKEANLLLKSLKESNPTTELLECETLSLVSNDDDSEHNSGSPINYRTYHKSWGLKKNIPVIDPQVVCEEQHHHDEEVEEIERPSKPKIVKPLEKPPEDLAVEVEEEVQQPKGIRGRRKPLYSKSVSGSKVTPKTLRPIKTMMKSVASSIKAVNGRNGTRPPLPHKVNGTTSTKTSPAKTKPKPLERQGTFTKDDAAVSKSRIPTTSKVAVPSRPSKIPARSSPGIGRSVNSVASTDRSRGGKVTYLRSTSADSREQIGRKMQSSVSSQSLKNERVLKGSKSSIPQKAGSNTSLNGGGGGTSSSSSSSTTTQKQVTSKIASLWKKIEESKNKQPAKKDTRVWIESGQQQGVSEGASCDNNDGVVNMRSSGRGQGGDNPEKRVSRLGSFIVMDETEDGARLQQIINAAAAAD